MEINFERFVENIDGVAFICDETGKLLYLSQNVEEICGYTNDEVLNRYYEDFIIEDDKAYVRRAFKGVLIDQSAKFECRIRHKNGDIIWLRITCHLVSDNGRPEVYGIGRDVTGEKVTDRLRKSYHMRSRIALENGRLGFFDWDVKNARIVYSDIWKSMLGYSFEEISNDFNEWKDRLHPDDIEGVFNKVDTLLSGKIEDYEADFRMRHKSGEYIWINARARTVCWDENEKPLRVIGTHDDITEKKKRTDRLKRSEKRYRMLVKNMDEGVAINELIYDSDTTPYDYRIVEVNPAFERILKLRRDEVQGKLSKKAYSVDTPPFLEHYVSICREGKSSTIERYVERFDKYFRINAFPLEKDVFVTVFSDITEERQYREHLKEEKRKAEKATQAKSRFLANMSHEIRTPLNGLIGFSSLLDQTTLDESQRLFVDNISVSAKTLMEVINDVLDLSKIEAGKLELEIKPASVKDIVADVVHVLEQNANEKEVALITEIDDRVPDRILTDPIRFKQVIMNLLSNAIKFTQEGSVKISCRINGFSEKSINLEFTVEDTGIGMIEDVVDRIYEPYTQADETITRRFRGTGLGLAITKTILERLGSSLNVKSELGKGSVFSFELKAIVVDSTDDVESGFQPRSAQRDESAGCKETFKLLIAEDNDVNYKLTEAVINEHFPNSMITRACNGEEVVASFFNDVYDIVLMDIQMPVMDGDEATRKIRQKDCQTPIVALTASSVKESLESYKRAGMNNYLIKPYSTDALITVLSSYLCGEGKSPSETSQQENSEGQLFDKHVLEDFFSNQKDGERKILEIIGDFLELIPEKIERLGEGIYEKDREKTIRTAHAIKGAASSIGAEKLFTLVDEIKESGEEMDWHKLEMLYANIERCFAELRTTLERVMAKGNKRMQ